MKIFKNSFLIFRYNLKNDEVKTYFFFKINIFCWKYQKITFNLDTINVAQIMLFYKSLDKDWHDKYRV